jgi:DNA-binding NtrC family response regulator
LEHARERSKNRIGGQERPNGSPRTALLVEDDEATTSAMVALATRESFEVEVASTFAEARAAIKQRAPHVVLCDIVLPDGNGLELLSDIDPLKTDLVVITGKASIDTVVTALRRGALDYLTKPVDVARLRQILNDVAVARGGAQDRAASLDEARRTGEFGKLVGRSPEMLRVYHQILRVAPTEATVLLQGETGTGKEMVATAILNLSPRSNEPFIPLNCGAVSTNLIESELFGHERGAFTGADRRHLGVFERAQNGTLFLDEITEMPMDLQVKLLRVLEGREFTRVGGEQVITTNARLIAATNRAPEDAIREGKLREDLFYRLRVFPIQLPPLRARTGDALLLAEDFVRRRNRETGKKKRLSDAAKAWIEKQLWPGNVRDLRNVIESAHIMADELIDVGSFDGEGIPHEISNDADAVDGSISDRVEVSADAMESQRRDALDDGEILIRVGSTIADAEKALILATLKRYDGDKSKSARVLGISIKTLYTRLSVYNASPSD